MVCILYFPHSHDDQDDWDDNKRRRSLLESGVESAQAHENYVVFTFQGKSEALSRWPEAGVIAGLRIEDIAATRLCCVVGPEEYFVCDSSQALSHNLGISYVVRNVKQEGGAHLLIAATSMDMDKATCIFSWQTRIKEHNKAALVKVKEIAAPSPKRIGTGHSHRAVAK